LGSLSKNGLRRFVTDRDLFVHPYLNWRYDCISAVIKPENMEEGMQLMHQYFTNPAIDKEAFDKLIALEKERLEKEASDSVGIFPPLSKINEEGDSFSVKPENIYTINIYKALELYKLTYGDAKDFVFVITGNFNMDSMCFLVSKYIGNLPSTEKQYSVNWYDVLQKNKIPIELNKSSITIYDGKLLANVQLRYSGKYEFSLQSNNEMNLLSQAISSLLHQKLRYVQGSVYDVDVGINTCLSGLDSGYYDVLINFSYPDCDIDNLVTAALNVVSDVRINGISEEEFQKVMAIEKKALEEKMNNHLFFLDYLCNQIKSGRALTEIIEQENELDSITREDIKRSATKYLSESSLSRFISLPRKKCL
jgi:zinc protease